MAAAPIPDCAHRSAPLAGAWLALRLAAVVALVSVAACERTAAPTALVYADRPVVVPPHALGWRSVQVGGSHSCGIRVDGTLYCWGSNASGQLGVTRARGQCTRATAGCEASPRAVATSARIAQVSLGDQHTCAVTTDGAVLCWGESLQFQTGVEAEILVPTPAQVSAVGRATQVSAGSTHTCAVRSDGVVLCWGEGRLGGLGRGDTLSSVIPRPIASQERFTAVSAGRWRSCGIAVDARLWCWGAEWESSTGNTDYFHERLVPHLVAGAPPMRAVSVAGSSICGVGLDGGGYCWESNAFGQLGTGTLAGTATPSRVLSSEPLASVTAGIIQTCGLTDAGSALCWGNDTFGQLGIPRTGERCGVLECKRSPARVFGGLRFSTVATGGGSHTCGITTDSALLCWGLGTEGQLGDGWIRSRQSLPVAVLAPSP